MGWAVGLHTSPDSSSRTRIASLGGSRTGSFDQGVSWFSRAFSDHVYPEPLSDARKPNAGFAMTLTHGAGVDWPGPRIVTYSLPPSANPPRPLKNSSSGRSTAI